MKETNPSVLMELDELDCFHHRFITNKLFLKYKIKIKNNQLFFFFFSNSGFIKIPYDRYAHFCVGNCAITILILIIFFLILFLFLFLSVILDCIES